MDVDTLRDELVVAGAHRRDRLVVVGPHGDTLEVDRIRRTAGELELEVDGTFRETDPYPCDEPHAADLSTRELLLKALPMLLPIAQGLRPHKDHRRPELEALTDSVAIYDLVLEAVIRLAEEEAARRARTNITVHK